MHPLFLFAGVVQQRTTRLRSKRGVCGTTLDASAAASRRGIRVSLTMRNSSNEAQGRACTRSRLQHRCGVFGFYSSSSKGQTGGPEPKDLSIGTASRRQNRIHEASCCTDTKARSCSAKLAAARRRLERAAQYTSTVSCPCPTRL